jgi:hypothetical protein
VQNMKALHYFNHTRILSAMALAAFASSVSAATLYVSLQSTNAVSPYDDWSRAATNIQDAVDAVLAGDEVVVTNGVYTTGGRAVGTSALVNRVAVDRPITLRSVNGPQFTIIQGYQLPGTTNGDGAIRCAYLTNGATLSGFTLTNGATRGVLESPSSGYGESSGGGVWCSSAVVSNCVLACNSAKQFGGGAYQGFLNNCLITSNSAGTGGGVSYSSLTNCLLRGNRASNNGGGADYANLINCTLLQNTGYMGGGADHSSLSGCLVVSNQASFGGGVYMISLLMKGCTVVGNSAKYQYGGVSLGMGLIDNSILFYNSAPANPNYDVANLICCCTTPITNPGIINNITNEPLFLDAVGGDYRLQPSSPCINAGRNSYATDTSTDLDGNPRIVSGTVDIGAYEFQGEGSQISYAWLQQYGLPTDGSADFADPDGDGMSNWQEWRVDTTPTNALSVLQMVTVTNGTVGLQVTWQSVATRTYFLDRATNFASLPAFQRVKNRITGQLGTTTYNDATATSGGPYFYRVGVVEP